MDENMMPELTLDPTGAAAAAQAARAYGVMEDAEAAPRPAQKRKAADASSAQGAGKAVIPQ